MKLSAFISLTWACCTAFPSSSPEYAPQSKTSTLSNFKPGILSDRDGLLWKDDFFNTDANANDANLATDTDTEGFVSEQDLSSSLNSGNAINGVDYDDSIQDDPNASLASADPLEGSCSSGSHSPPYSKVRLRNDAYCPSPKKPEVPSLPNLMDHLKPQLPIDVPLFNLNDNDEFVCEGPMYNKHLCCDGPRGPWIDRWSHYDFVLNCLPFLGSCESTYHEWCCTTYLSIPRKGSMCRLFPGVMVPFESDYFY